MVEVRTGPETREVGGAIVVGQMGQARGVRRDLTATALGLAGQRFAAVRP
ncbi:hypothetical protein [Streptomyces sp. NPDC005573]